MVSFKIPKGIIFFIISDMGIKSFSLICGWLIGILFLYAHSWMNLVSTAGIYIRGMFLKYSDSSFFDTAGLK